MLSNWAYVSDIMPMYEPCCCIGSEGKPSQHNCFCSTQRLSSMSCPWTSRQKGSMHAKSLIRQPESLRGKCVRGANLIHASRLLSRKHVPVEKKGTY